MTQRSSSNGPHLVRSGIDLGHGPMPLISGSLHYFRVPSAHWPEALAALQGMGVRIVETPVPWSVHQSPTGELRFATDSEHDLPAFLEAVATAGLYASLRLGPSVNAELTGFGIPGEVLWDEPCQARSAEGTRVIVPALPQAFPAPSLASAAFLNEAQNWLSGLCEVLGPFAFPQGPIVFLQLDNAACLWRDGLYDQDYHPDAVRSYRAFIQERYVSVDALRNAYGDSGLSFETLKPPERLNAHTAKGLLRHLDWAEFQEHVVAKAFSLFTECVQAKDLAHLPLCHHLPRSTPNTLLDPALLRPLGGLFGQDYSARAGIRGRVQLECQSGELVTLADRSATPAFAAELGAGFAPELGPISEEETQFAALTALAHGVNAFNICMAVDRDRWIGAPIGQRGQHRAGFDFWEQLLLAIEQTRLHELKQTIGVYVVVPRGYRRLCRVLNALGPVNLGLLGLFGLGPDDAASEEHFGLNHQAVQAVEAFLETLTFALKQNNVPYTFCSDDNFEFAVERGHWTIVASSGSLPSKLLRALEAGIHAGKLLSVGPHDPVRDEYWNPTEVQLPTLNPNTALPVWLGSDSNRIQEAVAALGELRHVSRTAANSEIETTTFHDAEGTLRVAFAINADPTAKVAAFPGEKPATDVLSLEAFAPIDGTLRIPVRARTVRMLRF